MYVYGVPALENSDTSVPALNITILTEKNKTEK